MASKTRELMAIVVLVTGWALVGPAAAQYTTDPSPARPERTVTQKPKAQKSKPPAAAQRQKKPETASPRQDPSPAAKLPEPEGQGGFKIDQNDLANVLKLPKGELKTNQFTIEYVPPTEAKHIIIYDMMREKKLLESFQRFLAPVRLPNQVKLQIAGCDGRANANFWQNTITVCYEYFEYIWHHTPKMAKAGLSPRDAMIGPTVDVFLHEAGHAILQLLDIPLLAREEDAADYIATYIILDFCHEDARRLILGASFISGSEAMEEQGKAPELAALSDVHSLPAVRYFNRWCMAYGKDPVLYADAIDLGMLTRQRAKHCAYEYSYISDAFKRLIRPYLDQEMVKEVKARKWWQFETPFADVLPKQPTATAQDTPGSEREPSAKR